MKTTILFLFITSISFGQNFLPTKDTIIYNQDGSENRYHVQWNSIQMETYKNGKWNGQFRGYYRNGKLWIEFTCVDGKREGYNIEYTPKGDTAEIIEWKEDMPYNKIIFYSSSEMDDQKYYLVSKKGFPLIVNGVQTTIDKTNAPDSLIEIGPFDQIYNREYMWIKGEQYGEEEGKRTIVVTTGNKPGIYELAGDKKKFYRPFTDGEKIMFSRSKKK